jgi:hypothetical protein
MGTFARFLSALKSSLLKRTSTITVLLFTAVPAFAPCQEATFPLPSVTGKLGHKDAGAVAEVAAHLRAVAASGWHDLEGTGTLTYDDGDAHSASLYLMGSAYTRLDVVMDSETRSVRLQSSFGSFMGDSGEQSSLLPKTSRTGIVAFSRLWTDALGSALPSLFDQGLYTGSGTSLHRITIEYPLNPGGYSSGDPTVATDLYFDPSTHLLLFSVDDVAFSNSSGQRFLRVTSYGDYQPFSGIQFPTQIQQTLNGQLQWSLQLSQITVNTNPPVTTFSF